MRRFRPSSSIMIAAAVATAAAVWMLTGLGDGSDRNSPGTLSVAVATRAGQDATDDRPASESRPAIRVSVQESTARRITREITVSARTEVNRAVELRAETEGRIVALGAERGRAIAAGDTVAVIDLRERNARLGEARALLGQMELQHEAALRLRGQQLAADLQIAEAFARLEAARATLEQIELDIARTRVLAPFDAFVQERNVELGDFVSVGDPVARLVDTDPLIVIGEVSERQVAELSIGGRGRAIAVTGDVLEGTIRYLAPVADESTRTFRVELAVANPGGALRAGMSADLRLEGGEIDAHFLSAAVLTLADDGSIGIKAVDDSDRVRFHPVDIASSGSDGIWATNLPERLRVIVVGQGFVNPGQIVEPVPVTSVIIGDPLQRQR